MTNPRTTIRGLEMMRGSRNVFRDLGRFTVDRLMMIINRLGSRVDVKIKVRRAARVEHAQTG